MNLGAGVSFADSKSAIMKPNFDKVQNTKSLQWDLCLNHLKSHIPQKQWKMRDVE